jgi:hypothetical protein
MLGLFAIRCSARLDFYSRRRFGRFSGVLFGVALRFVQGVQELIATMSTPKRIIANTDTGNCTLGGGGAIFSCSQIFFNRTVLL